MIPLRQWQQHRDAARLDSDARQRDAALADWVELCLGVAASVRGSDLVDDALRMAEHLRGWMSLQDSRIHSHVEEQVAAVQERLSESVTQSVVPLLTHSIRQKAVEDFCEALLRQTGEEMKEAFVIAAPADLHEALAAKLAASGLTAQIREADDQEITATCGPARLRTAMSAWTEELLDIVTHEA